MNMNMKVQAFANNVLSTQMDFDLNFTALFLNGINQLKTIKLFKKKCFTNSLISFGVKSHLLMYATDVTPPYHEIVKQLYGFVESFQIYRHLK